MASRNKLRNVLVELSGDEFHRKVTDILFDLVPNIAMTKRLGEYDRRGVDSYQYDPETLRKSLVVQCKGFEKPDFGPDQRDQCLREVDKFRRKGPPTDRYWLVVNRSIVERNHRDSIELALRDLVRAGKAESTALLDLERFILRVRALADDRLEAWADDRRATLKRYYEERLGFVDYIRDVPFEGWPAAGNDIVSKLASEIGAYFDSIPAHQAGRDRTTPKYLLSAGFGFGKTSTLHAFAAHWIAAGRQAIYVPAGLLSTQAFTNGAGLAASLLESFVPEGISDLGRLELRNALRREAAGSKSWVLLIDAIDESRYANDHNRLDALWNGVRELGLPTIVSVRDELFRLRAVEFRGAQSGSLFRELRLLDWSDGLILEFLHRYADKQGGSAPASFAAFRESVAEGNYLSLYGDIPRRPLFLGMLADDAWRGDRPERHLHRLYGKYFRGKFSFDRFSTSAEGRVLRTSKLVEQLGHEEACERLIAMMQTLADRMTVPQVSDGKVVLRLLDDATESQIERAAGEVGLPAVAIEDVALHSLLFPVGRDRLTGRRTFRFAHRSYQEWFLARSMALGEQDAPLNLPPSVDRFYRAIRSDLESGANPP